MTVAPNKKPALEDLSRRCGVSIGLVKKYMANLVPDVAPWIIREIEAWEEEMAAWEAEKERRQSLHKEVAA